MFILYVAHYDKGYLSNHVNFILFHFNNIALTQT